MAAFRRKTRNLMKNKWIGQDGLMGQDRTDRSTRRPALLVATLANFLTPFMGSSVNIALPSIGAEFAVDAIVLSWIPTAFLLAAAMVAVPSGRISDIYGMKRIFSYGVILFTAASLLSAISSSALSLIVFRAFQGMAGGLIVLGLGFGFFSSPNTSAIMGSVEKRFYGVASAMVSTMRLLGQMLSMGLALMVFALLIGNVRITPDRYPALLESIHTVLIICTVLCFLGIFVSLARGDHEKIETV
jgi:MFS family permease